MAENPEKNAATGEGWFNSWLNAAKNKSSEVLEFVKKDLEEFGTVVKNEASSVVSSAGSVVEKTLSLESPDSTVNTVKRSFSTFLGQMNTVLNPSPDDSDTEMLIVENSDTHTLSDFQKALYQLQQSESTFLTDPEDDIKKQYKCWLEILESDQLSDDRIARHVNSSEVLKKQYAKLVPDVVDHLHFWKRYLFKKALLEDEMARNELQQKREAKEEQELEGEHLKWELADFSANVELTEEQQIALLEEYEREQMKKASPKKEVLAVTTKQPTSEAKDKSQEKNEVTKKISTVDSAVSMGTGSSSSSTDDDWEKIGYVEK